MTEYREWAVWDRTTRWFHWINVLCVLALVGIGLVILNAGALDISNDGKVLLKQTHVWIGYLFLINLLWRFVWAFLGNSHARWSAFLPGGRGYLNALRGYVASFISGRPEVYLGHNPAGRLAIGLMFLLLLIQGVTGLVLAGTDIFYPPLGGWIAKWIAAPGVAPESLQPYAREMYDAGRYEEMRAFRKPFITVHLYGFYLLAVVIVLHIAAAVITDIREGGTIISAMFTGKKVIAGKPRDLDGKTVERVTERESARSERDQQ